MKRLRVGVLGATGMVGQRFVSLLCDHPWFELTCVAASPASVGRTYAEATAGRWSLPGEIPHQARPLQVVDASDVEAVGAQVDFVFSAVDLPKERCAALEESYARSETPVVSNTSAHRWTSDVPVVIPEVNAHHLAVISAQRGRLGTRRGFIVAKPNCSIQSYVPALNALAAFAPARVAVCTYQAVSGAGKTLASWPEMADNIVPFIKGEEEKSEQEPMKIWGTLRDGRIEPTTRPTISAQCIRVPVSDGHLAAVFVSFDRRPSREEILTAWADFMGPPQSLALPSAPAPFLRYLEEDDRPQPRLDRDQGRGQAICLGRLRPDALFDWRFVALSHNTIRGAAGGGVLTAELLVAEGLLSAR